VKKAEKTKWREREKTRKTRRKREREREREKGRIVELAVKCEFGSCCDFWQVAK
jgi:hypothetical protein